MAATVGASLQLFDNFTTTINRYINGIKQATSLSYQLNQALNSPMNVSVNNTNAVGQIQQVHNQLGSIPNVQNEMNLRQQKFNQSLQQSHKHVGDLTRGLKEVAAAYLSIEAGKKLLESTVGGAMEQMKMEDMLKARTGNDQVGAAMFEKFKADALKAGMDVKDTINGVLSFFSMTKNTNQISQLEDIAQRLNAFDTTGQGLEGAVFSVKEAMSGDILSLAERFNMSKAQIRAVKLDDYGKAGDIDNFIKAFNKLLEMQSMGQAAFDKMLQSPAKQAEILQNRIKSGFADAGKSATQALMPLIVTLNNAFDSGKFQSMLDGLSNGLRILANVTASVVQFMIDHWNLVKNTLIAVGVVLGELAMMWIVEWLAAAWPVLAIVAAIALVLTILNHFGISTGQVLGAVVGFFTMMVAAVKNQFAVLWNTILAVAEFLVNIFIDPVYAIKKLFYDLVKIVAEYFTNLINSVLGSVNWIIEKINEISGSHIKVVGKLDNNWVESLKPTTDKNVVDFSKYRMAQTNLADAYTAGQNFVGKALTSMQGIASKFDFTDWNKKADIDRVNSVGKIEDKVDISSEDLKVMRELAEMKAIQNFVTLTPTVQVTTGDIIHPTDVDEIVKRIEDSLEKDIASSAQGVFE